MTYTIYKLENTNARLCAGKTTTNDKAIADLVAKTWADQGFIVTIEMEG
jgi:hypothetical protein